MAGNEPPYLNVGTDVSAKYKGAFCEAKVKKVNRSVKVKVILKECHSSIIVTDDNIKGQLVIGNSVEVKQPSNGQVVDGVINKLTDSSTYTVVFDDGDEATLRRSQLCLKGDKHFTESETLDNLPLSHPEHFGTPVLQKKNKKAVNHGKESESEEESDSDESLPKRQTYKLSRHQELVGKVMMFENTERRKGTPLTVPVIIVMPDAHDTDLRTKDHLLVRSFKDSKYFSVLKKELKEFNRDAAVKSDIPVLKNAMEKALSYFDNNDLPSSWKREELLGSDDENEEEESSDDEQNEEKDRFVAQLYKFMDDRGTPINKGPSVGVYDLNLYRLFKIVQNLGGYNKVTNHDKWRVVYNKMGLPSSNSASSQMKNAYKKFLHAFEDFYRKLGSTMGTLSRPGRHRNNSGRSILQFRGRDKDTANSPRLKKEEKEIDDSCSDRSKTTKSDDASDTDSLFKEDSDSETPTMKRSVTRRDKQKEEKEKRESMKLKVEEEEKRSTRRDKDDDKNSLKEEKMTPKKEKNDSDEKEDSVKKRVTRRKSGRVGEDGKKDEEEEEEEKEKEMKKKGKGSDKEEKKPEEKKLTRKDLKDKKGDKPKEDKPKEDKSIKEEKIIKEDKNMKEEKIIKEDKNSVKEEKISKEDKNSKDDRSSNNSNKDETEDDEEDLNLKMEEDDKKKELPLGTKVRVKYGRGKNIKLYEAKVVEAGKDGGQKTYLVHYAGWNNRYDEWIKRERIVGILDRPDSAKKQQLRKPEVMVPSPKMSPKASLKQQLVNQIQKKRGRPGVGTPPPTGAKSSEFRIPTTRSPQPTPSPTTTPVTKNRPTRSNSLDNKTALELTPDKKRKTKKSTGVNDNSDQQSRESDESTDTDEEMETDDKIPDLSETGSLSKTPDREEPESELEANMEEEAPELEAMKPLEELPPVTQEPPPPISPEKPEERPKSPEPVEIEPVLEPVVEKSPNKPIKDLKEKPKEVKEKPKEVKEKPKEVKEKPKEVKEKPKEVKEKPKEPKEKPKDIKEKLRELKEIKEIKEKMKEMKGQFKEKEKPKEMTQKIKEIKEKVKEAKETRRVVAPEPKPAEIKAASIYDFEDTEIGEDFKIEEKKVKKDPTTSDFDIDNLEDIVNSFLCPDPSRLDRVEEIQMKLQTEKEENEKKKIDLTQRLNQFEEMLRNENKSEVKEDGEKEKKIKKKDLKDSAKKDNKDGKAGLKRGRPPLDKSLTDLPVTPKPDPMFASSAILTSLTKKVIESPLEESMDGKLKKDILDSKPKKEKKRDSGEKTPSVEDDKLSDFESKELVDNLEKKKVKKKIKKKIFGENLNDSSEPLAFSDLNKDNLELMKSDLKKDIKTPKSANKDKTPKPKESKKAKDSDFSKELSSPVLTSAINSAPVPEFSSEKKEKRMRSRSVSPVAVKVAKFEDPDKSESLVELNVPKVVSSYTKEVKVLEVSSDSAIISPSLTEIESNSKTSVVASMLDSPNPRIPEPLKNTAVPSASTVQVVKSKEDNSNMCDQMSNSGGESPNTVNNNCGLEGTESSSVIPSSENSNDIDTLLIKRKRDSDDSTPTKKQKRRSTKANKQAERNRSKFNGSDSEDTNSSKFPSPNHTPGSPHKHFDSPRPPRSPKYNFNIEKSNYLFGEQKIVFITDKMKEIRQMYLTLKTEVANIDKKRKRARRKERDSQSSHLDNESS